MFHTAGAPPSKGSAILANIGCTANTSNALRKEAAAKSVNAPPTAGGEDGSADDVIDEWWSGIATKSTASNTISRSSFHRHSVYQGWASLNPRCSVRTTVFSTATYTSGAKPLPYQEKRRGQRYPNGGLTCPRNKYRSFTIKVATFHPGPIVARSYQRKWNTAFHKSQRFQNPQLSQCSALASGWRGRRLFDP